MGTLDKLRSHINRPTPTTKQASTREDRSTTATPPSGGTLLYKTAMIKAAAEITRLQTEVDERNHELEAIKLAHTLVLEGHLAVEELMEKAAELQTKDLEVIKEAIKLGGVRHNSFGNLTGDDKPGSSASDPLTAFLLNT